MDWKDALQNGPLLLDGATGSNLMAAGLPAGVCVEQWVLDHPDVLLRLQQDFVAAGARVVLAPTFGANPQKLAAYDLADQTEDFNHRLVALSRRAVGNAAWVAGDLSPSGLFLPPMGTASFADLCAVYDRQLAALQTAGVDLVVIETQMTLADARAALLCAKARGMTALVTITVEAGGRTLTGLSLPAAVVTLQAMGADGVGLNCSCGPAAMAALLQEATAYAAVPLIAKPNAGEADDPLPPEAFATQAAALADAGACLIGGCCGTTPAHLACLSRALADHAPPTMPQAAQNRLADERDVYDLPTAGKEETFAASPDLMDDMMDADDEAELAVITLQTPADAAFLADALPLCRKPVCFAANDTAALEAALQAYQGRALVAGAGVTADLLTRYGALRRD